MKKIIWLSLTAATLGCDFPGKPNPEHKFEAPNKVVDFSKLYGKNCAGCHGQAGNLGPAPPLNDPQFLGLITDAELTGVIRHGRPGTEMPAFAKDQGGTLTNAQIQALVNGLRKKWGRENTPGPGWPSYSLPKQKGDKSQGRLVFARACSSCHGIDGQGTQRVGPLNDATFLALASEQFLRRMVITGRSDLGMPNCLEGEGRPLTATEINDVVALMMSWKHEPKARR